MIVFNALFCNRLICTPLDWFVIEIEIKYWEVKQVCRQTIGITKYLLDNAVANANHDQNSITISRQHVLTSCGTLFALQRSFESKEDLYLN